MAAHDERVVGAQGETPAKRARTDNPHRFSMEPDVHVQVEDKAFPVHSLVLMLASPVFKNTLASGMSESSSGTITLHGKKKCEFQTFIDAIKPDSTLTINAANVHTLSRWSDEYQVDGLKNRCDQYLRCVPVSVEELEFAMKYNMAGRQKMCMRAIKTDFPRFQDELARRGSELPAEVLEPLWPHICACADLPDKSPMPGLEHVRIMWPFVARTLKKKPDAEIELERIRQHARQWPDQLYSQLPASHQADSKGMIWLRSQLRGVGLV
eukprot:CAMPEP_0198535512 /NCGR_PEP_ID=MMETSP1462-20131121/39748_1 /TAXON_ID=1333877 /ORGANISM="Brandtodinium nutriculum, Strain RCC3387" /LENGTH=266 /DNA_ID=CAMNT_0044265451 /DNA_START=130 /DNA_END=930 /DNA_ORIENTATION=+